MVRKVKYTPSTIDIIGGVVFLLISIGMLLLAISLEFVSGNMGRKDIVFITIVVMMGIIGLVKLYRFSTHRNREIVLDTGKMVIPHANDCGYDEVALSDIKFIEKSYDGLFLKVITDQQEYKIDLSWINDEKALSSLIEEIKKQIPNRR